MGCWVGGLPRPAGGSWARVCVLGKGAMLTDGHDRSMKDDDNQLGTLSPPILSNDHGDLSIQHGFPPFSFSVSTISTIPRGLNPAFSTLEPPFPCTLISEFRQNMRHRKVQFKTGLLLGCEKANPGRLKYPTPRSTRTREKLKARRAQQPPGRETRARERVGGAREDRLDRAPSRRREPCVRAQAPFFFVCVCACLVRGRGSSESHRRRRSLGTGSRQTRLAARDER